MRVNIGRMERAVRLVVGLMILGVYGPIRASLDGRRS